jgi:DNA-binding MarR family transcriptional regulator
MSRVSATAARHADALLREVVRRYEQTQRSTQACCRGASAKECEALVLLGRAGAISVQEFADRMGLEKTWASRLADRLQKRGVIKRVDHPNDGRSWLLELTAKGRDQCCVLDDALDEHAINLLARIPAADRATVERALAILCDALAPTATAGTAASCSK